jgi:ABC-type xylose transport system substrate-binding protein
MFHYTALNSMLIVQVSSKDAQIEALKRIIQETDSTTLQQECAKVCGTTLYGCSLRARRLMPD